MHDIKKVGGVMGLFQGKIAVVSGGSRGIGRAIVLMLAREGCSVAFNYVHNTAKAEALVKEVQGLGVECVASQVDVCDFEAVKKWIDESKARLGGLDIVVNNAGVIRDKNLLMMPPEDWHTVINTNLNGMFHVSRASIFHLLKQRRGHIVNISSISGSIGLVGQTNYSASKGGMNAFTKALAKECAPYGVRVNAVAPGFIETDMLEGIDEASREAVLKGIPLGRIRKADDVAGVVRFLLSEESAYILGQIIQVDGGLAIR